ncbi:bifunctional 4-hydroxy-2-oxoglutarate aldolase/2-dehydro-3-deoxy-phosphogluconate aldolase [Thalassotalea piscium]|uniref:2-dehydro-3-deoxy-phosphogluconate aldolase n=1 Tax=Thalassotalea piscium TaxID=1230533 RepID=A0A7X0TSM4_9GAMM|nr:bifunctional 4-hydroxy-2-oxoglutarate aldolase/2-dehydro-3-deoxy-phosphogluconate aldolase [Thalassotalea piscium]MBB6542308.1 2-dehydro-3-deoxyphosphogluconate aldolase/(4S)-4-hydroxy-2-oxoglutarate aldolase [Thalassotalea piscium]
MTVVRNWKVSPKDLFEMGPVIPVLVIENVEDALPIAKALLSAGIKVLEVTLRTPSAFAVIKKIAQELPDAIVGAGTVTNKELLQRSIDAGAKFAISPGLTKDLLQAANEGEIPLIPGVSSISELMDGIDLGYDHFKFFPAEASGGVKAIQSIGGPFPHIKFCPTGGINIGNIRDYLALNNVICCGGSWLVSDEIIANKDWKAISALSKQVLSHVN